LLTRPLSRAQELTAVTNQTAVIRLGDATVGKLPLTGLDPPSQAQILAVIDEERAAGRTVVTSTHSLADAATADHLLLLAGRVVAEGSPEEVLTEAILTEAYGTMVVRFGDRSLLVDDSTHHHPN
jgi:ABC-type cobalamin/Fe3+-siderophores transport system ATPase subunit